MPQDKGEAISRHLLRPIGAEAHVALTASVNDMADSSDPSNPEPEDDNMAGIAIESRKTAMQPHASEARLEP